MNLEPWVGGRGGLAQVNLEPWTLGNSDVYNVFSMLESASGTLGQGGLAQVNR